jgi:hypothetical protein
LIIPYECNQTVEEYARLGRKNDFPTVECCPHCRGVIRMKRHGYYWRNALENDLEYRIPICRLKCPSCGKTFSLLPSFLLPYFQHTLRHIIKEIHIGLTKAIYRYRQRIEFYRKRYLGKLKQVEMFFRSMGFRGKLPNKPKEKAIKLLEMIQAFGEATFVRRSKGHFKTNFMAL